MPTELTKQLTSSPPSLRRLAAYILLKIKETDNAMESCDEIINRNFEWLSERIKYLAEKKCKQEEKIKLINIYNECFNERNCSNAITLLAVDKFKIQSQIDEAKERIKNWLPDEHTFDTNKSTQLSVFNHCTFEVAERTLLGYEREMSFCIDCIYEIGQKQKQEQ